MPTDERHPLGDLPDPEIRRLLRRAADWAAGYRETLEARPISPRVRPGEIASALDTHLPEAGEPLDRIFSQMESLIVPGVVHWGHPAFLGYFGSTSNGPALVGEIAAAALNVSAMTWRTSPAATELETVVLSWIRGFLGLPEEFFGVVYDTASVALLHALAAAREERGPDVRRLGLAGRGDIPTFRVYASEEAHSSIEKASVVLGLGEANVVRIPSSPAFELDVRVLSEAMESDRRAGMTPMAVIATVGTTSTASVDPVRAIASVARAHGAWLHVDAAYGGALGLLPERRHVLDGVELADSVVVNGHKWLFVPLDFSALFVRRPDALRSVFALTPEYLRGDASPETEGAAAAVDYMDYGIQLGRRFRALKAWMAFRAFGRAGLAARIREHCRLAEVFANLVFEEPGFVVSAPVVMAVVCFRYCPPGASEQECDAVNAGIVESVNGDGEAYLTRTVLGGRTVMRVGVGNIRTEERHVRRVWELIREAASRTRAAGQIGGPEK